MTPPQAGPDPTAERVALWRALHAQLDVPPVFEDPLVLPLLAPAPDWVHRPDMDPQGSARARASIAGRSRFVEEHLEAQAALGVTQYISLGAGLDTLALRRSDLADRLQIFELDLAAPQAWKQQRLRELGWPVPPSLRFLPVDFEQLSEAAWADLLRQGIDPERPTVVAALGVSMYLTERGNLQTLRRVASLAPGSSLIMSFQLPTDWLDPSERGDRDLTLQHTHDAGLPWVSIFNPVHWQQLAAEAGFRSAQYIDAAELTARYFTGRADGLRPSSAEALLLCRTS
jgi:methyltransferase (TIGR00027 family)